MALLRCIHSGSALGAEATGAAALGAVLHVFDLDCAPQAPTRKRARKIDQGFAYLEGFLMTRTLGGRAFRVKRAAVSGQGQAGSAPRLDAGRHARPRFAGDAAGAFA